MSHEVSHGKLTTLQRQALDAMRLHRGFRRSELTATEKRTTTGLLKRGMVELDHGFYVVTAAGSRQLTRSQRPEDQTNG